MSGSVIVDDHAGVLLGPGSPTGRLPPPPRRARRVLDPFDNQFMLGIVSPDTVHGFRNPTLIEDIAPQIRIVGLHPGNGSRMIDCERQPKQSQSFLPIRKRMVFFIDVDVPFMLNHPTGRLVDDPPLSEYASQIVGRGARRVHLAEVTWLVAQGQSGAQVPGKSA